MNTAGIFRTARTGSGFRRATRARLLGALAGVLLSGAASALPLPASPGAPDVGQKAPEFRLPDARGAIASLPEAEASGGRSARNWTLLVFYRGYW